jgi:hypothetical protein
VPQAVDCSKCDKPSTHSIFVRNTTLPPPPPDQKDKDTRGVRVVRFCDAHWDELEEFLRAA